LRNRRAVRAFLKDVIFIFALARSIPGLRGVAAKQEDEIQVRALRELGARA
jgi:hypothetical protein